jgi:4-hydroxy-L-threonine phosphate dehydrogenase PdxA
LKFFLPVLDLPSKRCLRLVTYFKNISHGLPNVRTSVDHGIAFDIAWQGKIAHANMTAAIDFAFRLATGPGW